MERKIRLRIRYGWMIFILVLFVSMLLYIRRAEAASVPEGTYTPEGSYLTYTFAGDNTGYYANVESYSSKGIVNGTITIPSMIVYMWQDGTRDSVRVRGILPRAFSSCTSLQTLILPDSIACIGEEAFSNCSNLVSIQTVADDASNPSTGYLAVEEIGYRAFYGCTSLTGITFGEKVRENSGVHMIDNEAFMNCSSLNSVEIGQPVTSIGDGAFAKCESLGNPTGGIKVTDNALFFVQNGILYYRESNYENILLCCPAGIQDEILTEFADNVTQIRSEAFYGCKGLSAVTIPKTITAIGEAAFQLCTGLKTVNMSNRVTSIGSSAFNSCKALEEIILPNGITSIASNVFAACAGLKNISIPAGVESIGECAFDSCMNLTEISIPGSVTSIQKNAFLDCSSLKDIFYSDNKNQWEKIEIDSMGNAALLNAAIHFADDSQEQNPEETILPPTMDARQELESLKSGDTFLLIQNFQYYLSEDQIDIIESCLYTWLAEINYAYKYSGSSSVKEHNMKKAGIDPQGEFAAGAQQAVTHISAETKYGPKTFEIVLELGKPDSSGNLYPAYGTMHYEVLEKESIPSDIPKSGQIGRSTYTDLGPFIESVSKASEDSLHSTFQWQILSDEMTAGILADKTVTEIIGNKNGSFTDGAYIVYAKPLLTYSKKVTISCPVDVYVCSMDGKEVGSVVDNEPSGGDQNVRFDINGDIKTVYLTGNDYYLNLCGTDTGTMKYEVEEIANDNVRRNVQFLELQLEKDMQYEGYVFRPLNIDQDLYALRTVGGSGQEVFYADEDKSYETLSLFKRIQGLTLSQQNTSLDANKTVQLNAGLYPLDASNPNLLWTTDNTSVAKVDNNGLVTAVGSGRATVTVSTRDGSFLKQYCVIDVSEKSSGTGGSSGSSSSGWYGGGTVPSVEQEKNPVVVKLHYVLQFNANGGTNLSRRTMTLLADDCPGIMPKVNRKDYVFDGWYTQQDGGTQVTGDRPLTEAATVYAHWTKVEAPAKAATPTLESKKKGQIQVRFENINGAVGYQIEYSENNQFTSISVKEAGASVNTKAISGLKAGQKYYVRIRAYSVDSMKNRIYGAYSAVKSVKVEG